MRVKQLLLWMITAVSSLGLLKCASPSGGGASRNSPGNESARLTRFTFVEACGSSESDPMLAAIMQELKDKGTVIELMKQYSDAIQGDISTESPYFAKLQKIFDCGVTPLAIQGYYHGAVVAFRNEAFLNCFNINTLNQAWPVVRLFSPWRGKTFEPMSLRELGEITGGAERGEAPTVWGSNVYRDRGFRERIAVAAMKGLGMKVKPATAEEIRTCDYDLKGFFFIARRGPSVNPANRGKVVYQFNYRWPRLETFPPDNYCMDEIVQIAEGLYLGQLVYATDLKRKYDHAADPQVYRYRNFGYFLLMDDEWQKEREKISFDLQGGS